MRAEHRGDVSAEALRQRLGLGNDALDIIEALVALGVSPAAMERANARGQLQDAIFDMVLDPDRASRTVSAQEIEDRGGAPVSHTLAMTSAFGFPRPQPDEPYFSAAEADALVALGARREWWPTDVQLEISRVWGQALSRIAAAEVDNFRLGTEVRARGELSPADALATIQRVLAELLPLADPLILGVHRRWIDYELTQYVVRTAEEQLPHAVPGTVDCCLLFCDLKGFTAFAERHGDAAATVAASRLAEVSLDQRGAHGRVVKGLGDGAMLVFPDAAEAVAAWRRIRAEMAESQAPALHGSVHQATVVRREGDYFGGAVNLAARLLALAGADQLLATDAAVQGAGQASSWKALGKRHVRGLRAPIDVYCLEPG